MAFGFVVDLVDCLTSRYHQPVRQRVKMRSKIIQSLSHVRPFNDIIIGSGEQKDHLVDSFEIQNNVVVFPPGRPSLGGSLLVPPPSISFLLILYYVVWSLGGELGDLPFHCGSSDKTGDCQGQDPQPNPLVSKDL